jgi:hypothetical protein
MMKVTSTVTTQPAVEGIVEDVHPHQIGPDPWNRS